MTDWQPPQRGETAAAAYAAAEADRTARPDRYRLDPDLIAEIAARPPGKHYLPAGELQDTAPRPHSPTTGAKAWSSTWPRRSTTGD